MNLNSRTELEEERRLFYVALTRAEKKIYLSYVLQDIGGVSLLIQKKVDLSMKLRRSIYKIMLFKDL